MISNFSQVASGGQQCVTILAAPEVQKTSLHLYLRNPASDLDLVCEVPPPLYLCNETCLRLLLIPHPASTALADHLRHSESTNNPEFLEQVLEVEEVKWKRNSHNLKTWDSMMRERTHRCLEGSMVIWRGLLKL